MIEEWDVRGLRLGSMTLKPILMPGVRSTFAVVGHLEV